MTTVQHLRRAYHAFDDVFTDHEAWGLFKLTAYLETVGWTLLITAIISKVIGWHYGQAYIAVAGSIHGMFYLFYMFIVVFGHGGMRWSAWKTVGAAGLSNVPYGALVFELWLSRQRRHKQLATQYATAVYYVETRAS